MGFIKGRENVTFFVYSTLAVSSESRPSPSTIGTTSYPGIAAFGESFGSGLSAGEIPEMTLLVDKNVPIDTDSIIKITEKSDGTDLGNFRIVSVDRGTILGGGSQVKRVGCVKYQFYVG